MMGPQNHGAGSGTLTGLPSSRARIHWIQSMIAGRPLQRRALHWPRAVSGCVQTMKTFTPNGGYYPIWSISILWTLNFG